MAIGDIGVKGVQVATINNYKKNATDTIIHTLTLFTNLTLAGRVKNEVGGL